MVRFVGSGAIAGAISTVVFTIVHGIFISNIWSMLVIMLAAGALCGASISWSYGLLVVRPSLPGWLLYNLILDSLLILLGVISVLLFEPTTTIAALTEAGNLPLDLLGEALPMAAAFALLIAVGITMGYGLSWPRFGSVLITTVLLTFLLGHNVFILGLVEIPRGSLYLVFEMFGLIVMLNLVFVMTFIGLEHKRLRRRGGVQLELG